MILFMPDPTVLLQEEQDKKLIKIQLPSGGNLTAEVMDGSRWKIVDICSTDPMDYMNPKTSPGRIITIEDLL